RRVVARTRELGVELEVPDTRNELAAEHALLVAAPVARERRIPRIILIEVRTLGVRQAEPESDVWGDADRRRGTPGTRGIRRVTRMDDRQVHERDAVIEPACHSSRLHAIRILRGIDVRLTHERIARGEPARR